MEKIIETLNQLYKDVKETDALFARIKSLGKKPRYDRKAYESPYAKFDRNRRKRK